MALYQLSPFEAKVLRGMRERKLPVRRILKTFPPFDTGDLVEVLFVSMTGEANTVFVNEQGKVCQGPFSGFGL